MAGLVGHARAACKSAVKPAVRWQSFYHNICLISQVPIFPARIAYSGASMQIVSPGQEK